MQEDAEGGKPSNNKKTEPIELKLYVTTSIGIGTEDPEDSVQQILRIDDKIF
jgi:hypothetical protein